MRFKEGSDWTGLLPLPNLPRDKQPRTYQEFFNYMYRDLIPEHFREQQKIPQAVFRRRESFYYKDILVVGYKRTPCGSGFILIFENGEKVEISIIDFVRLSSKY